MDVEKSKNINNSQRIIQEDYYSVRRSSNKNVQRSLSFCLCSKRYLKQEQNPSILSINILDGDERRRKKNSLNCKTVKF